MMQAANIVRNFWNTMATNDFTAASHFLSEDFTGDWPQSGERIVGRANFAAINATYPAKGPWQFDVQRLVANDDEVVTDVAITDGDLMARAITFHMIRNDLIARQIEYWPDPYDAPTWRAQWISRIPQS